METSEFIMFLGNGKLVVDACNKDNRCSMAEILGISVSAPLGPVDVNEMVSSESKS